MRFDEFTLGPWAEAGGYAVTREDVIEFATRFDPQPFHIDDEAAAANPVFGRISASAMHTLSITARLTFECFKEKNFTPLTGLGMDEMRLLKPVYPGDTFSVRHTVVSVRPSAKRPGRGVVVLRTERSTRMAMSSSASLVRS